MHGIHTPTPPDAWSLIQSPRTSAPHPFASRRPIVPATRSTPSCVQATTTTQSLRPRDTMRPLPHAPPLQPVYAPLWPHFAQPEHPFQYTRPPIYRRPVPPQERGSTPCWPGLSSPNAPPCTGPHTTRTRTTTRHVPPSERCIRVCLLPPASTAVRTLVLLAAHGAYAHHHVMLCGNE